MTVTFGAAGAKTFTHVMEIDMVIDWLSILLLGFAFWAYKGGYKKGEEEGLRQAYQNELNYRMEVFLDEQNSK